MSCVIVTFESRGVLSYSAATRIGEISHNVITLINSTLGQATIAIIALALDSLCYLHTSTQCLRTLDMLSLIAIKLNNMLATP